MKSLIPILLFSLCALSPAAQVLMINFSSASGNDMNATNATALGVDVYQNVRTGTWSSSGVSQTATISLDSVTGSVNWADYYQANQLSALGQPYATFVGARLIASGTGAGQNLSVLINLDLDSWMTTGDYTSYKVTLYYAGRSAAAETLMTDGDADVHFDDGTTTADDTMTVALHGSGSYPAFFGGIGEVHEFSGSDLEITMDYLGGTSSGYQAGISAIKIEAVPEPSAALLGGLGVLALLRRRRG